MDTDSLVAALARNEPRVVQGGAARRYAVAVVVGGLAALLLLEASLGLRPDLSDALRDPRFWVKLGLPAVLLAAALAASVRLGRPGAPVAGVAVAPLIPVAAIWLLAIAALLSAPAAERAGLIVGQSWSWCLGSIAVLSIPTFILAFWAMRGLAPTMPALAGAFAGLLAGSVAAAVYTLHCPEMEAPFVATWYVLGIATPTLLGALAGRPLLRW